MKYITYNVATTAYYKHPRTGKCSYTTESAARAAITRMNRDYPDTRNDDIDIAPSDVYHETIEATVTVKCLMPPHQEIQQSINTPRACDPSSNLYWSM